MNTKNEEISEHASTRFVFTSEGKEDFKNILKSLDLENLSKEKIEKLAEIDPNYTIDFKFLDSTVNSNKEDKYPYIKLFDEKAQKFNLSIDEEKLRIELNIQNTFTPYDKENNHHIESQLDHTIKDIAKRNNSSLQFEHEEQSIFLDGLNPKVISMYYDKIYDKTGKDIDYDPDGNWYEIVDYKSPPKVNSVDIEVSTSKNPITEMSKDIIEKIKKPFKLKEKKSNDKGMER